MPGLGSSALPPTTASVLKQKLVQCVKRIITYNERPEHV